ncbi:hypothetical protein KAM622c_41300 [Klebsiella quasipneumoniae subsp. quasipneumoniae]|nr:hypothetical protein KAM622c_41300 [Klebsiella quasipneumoniae subsp. quasipneumoniae]
MRSDPGKLWAPRLIPLMTNRFLTTVHEFTVGMILLRRINIGVPHDALRDKYWRKDSPNHQASVKYCGKVVGLVGGPMGTG